MLAKRVAITFSLPRLSQRFVPLRAMTAEVQQQHQQQPPTAEAKEVAVVGGGISGLSCARFLAQCGYNVTVFDMGKTSPGGRTATRSTSWKSLRFDHGCQFFTARSAEFRAVVDEWATAGVAERWDRSPSSGEVSTSGVNSSSSSAARLGRYDAATGTFTPRTVQQPAEDSDPGFFDLLAPGPIYVGTPSMDAICRHLASSSNLAEMRQDVRVTRAALEPDSGKWLLEGQLRHPMRTGEDRKQQALYTPWNLGVFDALVLADKMTGAKGTPGFVSIEGSSAATQMQVAMEEVGSSPQMALLLAYEQAAAAAMKLPFDGATVIHSPHIQWISNDSTKPGHVREDGLQCFVVLTSPSFSTELIPRGPDGKLPPQTPEYLAQLAPRIQQGLSQALRAVVAGLQLPEPVFVQAHRWGSAFPAQPIGSACLKAESARLAACGDFCLGAGIENAVLSARAAADAVRQMFE